MRLLPVLLLSTRPPWFPHALIFMVLPLSSYFENHYAECTIASSLYLCLNLWTFDLDIDLVLDFLGQIRKGNICPELLNGAHTLSVPSQMLSSPSMKCLLTWSTPYSAAHSCSSASSGLPQIEQLHLLAYCAFAKSVLNNSLNNVYHRKRLNKRVFFLMLSPVRSRFLLLLLIFPFVVCTALWFLLLIIRKYLRSNWRWYSRWDWPSYTVCFTYMLVSVVYFVGL